jgi:hypothetical protein
MRSKTQEDDPASGMFLKRQYASIVVADWLQPVRFYRRAYTAA